MADLRHEKDHKLRLPDKTHASNGKSIYKSGAFDRAVSYFCCDTKIEFDTLYPYTCLTTTAYATA
ncbi:hypothetical protein JG687_00019399 [Phytophthora cactorum]|uniref:Uncharacterized protein n=1 Tax=Phytophthora cactorum TaxID=29920 RepID=A0A329RER9_9STRA|nr:hypothetical protein PC129_g22881 [Phytophthora cactorum]KAG6941866.1 hypothetical protein JG687_00019399 [Phytophthora cactorum]RAW23024.1 hypothetical protein PC110_g20539 [Phytophthora cactorum]